ncbi:PH domain-containing protein [Corallococcus sp. M34]|uniref:PH domain-containing protein n=1 Tax=Citreicoccus inhibens TaxID=2849499 RepID=UPI001C2184B6|nr:PH domain-containing protein [Citreicoccus inhibens]MBU8896741.1 PH domain-containing protein [Citreicoccus inhibens]
MPLHPVPVASTPAPVPSGLRLPAVLRPHSSLFTYYVLSALLSGPAFPLMLAYLYFRFHTLRYELDEEGLTMRWGILFRREVSLTYARLQDIHLTSNVVERWLGLGRVQLQTASGSSEAEVTIEGLREFEAMRDFLYGRMRGAKEHVLPAAEPLALTDSARLAEALREVAAEVRALRAELDARAKGGRDV